MLAFNVKKKRFTLLYLEENELYVQDLTGSCSFPDPSSDTRKYFHFVLLILFQTFLRAFCNAEVLILHRSEKGKIHLCSKSIIFEANNPNIPIYKFLYRDLKTEPKRSKAFLFILSYLILIIQVLKFLINVIKIQVTKNYLTRSIHLKMMKLFLR